MIATPTMETTPQLTAEEQAEARLRRLNRAKNALWKSLLHLQPAYQMDPDNIDALNGLAHWLVQLPYNSIQPGKGIMLQGPVGTGKTDLMNALSHAFVLGGSSAFQVVNAKRIEKEFNRSDDGSRDRNRIGGDHVILHYANIDHLCIDDIGLELDGVHYGRSANIIAEIIALRYDKFRKGSNITHLTSNAAPEQMEKRYDLRTLSRISEMCGEIYVGGPDRRRTSQMPKSLHVMPDLFSPKEERPMPTDDEVRSHFARLKSTIAEVTENLVTTGQRRAPATATSQATDLEDFGDWCETASGSDLQARRFALVNQYGPDSLQAKPFIALIDKALEAMPAQPAAQ